MDKNKVEYLYWYLNDKTIHIRLFAKRESELKEHQKDKLFKAVTLMSDVLAELAAELTDDDLRALATAVNDSENFD